MVPSLTTLHPAFVWEEETQNPVNTVLNRGVEWRGTRIEEGHSRREEEREREKEREIHSGKLLTTATKMSLSQKKKIAQQELSSSLIWKVKSLTGRRRRLPRLDFGRVMLAVHDLPPQCCPTPGKTVVAGDRG